jgi:hypothetical protein
MDIMKIQFEKQLGIYLCDDTAVISFGKVLIGKRGAKSVYTLPTPAVPVGRSKDNTAGNALQFMKMWETVKGDGRYGRYDWTVKVDPDAVLVPDRLRRHLVAAGGSNAGSKYIKNCGKFNTLFGSIEVVSRQGLDEYNQNVQTKCVNSLAWKDWGEDVFMTGCFEKIGVGYSIDFTIVQDGVCGGVWCGNVAAAAFHPFKSVGAWESCWHQATR